MSLRYNHSPRSFNESSSHSSGVNKFIANKRATNKGLPGYMQHKPKNSLSANYTAAVKGAKRKVNSGLNKTQVMSSPHSWGLIGFSSTKTDSPIRNSKNPSTRTDSKMDSGLSSKCLRKDMTADYSYTESSMSAWKNHKKENSQVTSQTQKMIQWFHSG